LFIDYFLGNESIKIMAKLGEFVNVRASIHRCPMPIKFSFYGWIKFDTRAYAEKKKDFQKIFLR
jgi:hypothetical protein